MADDIEQMRAELDAVDAALVDLLARRSELVTRIGRDKARRGLATRDFERERAVLDRVGELAAARGVDVALARDVMLRLIDASLTTQEHDRMRRAAGGAGRRALVIGGAGRMGRWMVSFLASQGYVVTVADPGGRVDGAEYVDDWRAALDTDVIVVSTPLHVTGPLLVELAGHAPRGLVFDLGSLKTPLRDGLQALVDAGVHATSVHPMFGPDTRMLSGRHVIFVDAGVPDATAQAHALFADTMASRVTMSIDDHDRLVAYVLGLSHAVNIAFFTAVAGSGESAARLAEMSSTTFDAQLDVAGRVAHESPALYYEIQALNAHGGASLDALAAAVDAVRGAVSSGDREAFVALMERGRAWFDGRRALRDGPERSEPAGR